MIEETSEDLLAIIGMKDDPEMVSDAKAAFNEFYGRFRNFVYRVCFNLSKSFENNKQVSEDIFQDTFIDVYKNAGRFDASQFKDVGRGIKAWLSGISRNAFLKYIDKASRFEPEALIIEKYFHELLDEPSDDINFEDLSSIELQAIKNALNSLNKKEREILLIYFQFYDGEKFNVPKKIRLGLAKAHNIQPDSLRQTKDRALKKIRKYIQEKTELTINKTH